MSKAAIPLAEAQRWAEYVRAQLLPHCIRCEVAGSIRRRKASIGDIEIVCIPEITSYVKFREVVDSWGKLKGDSGGKMTQRRVPGCPLTLDLFMCNPATWPCILLIRTGSAEFSQRMMETAKAKKFKFADGRLLSPAGVRLRLDEEAQVFQWLGMRWVEPWDR